MGFSAMNGATSKMRDLAQWLVAHETNKSSGAKAPAAFGVVQKLRRPLAALTGVSGFRSLLSRALALANPEVRWLRAVHVKSDGSLECPAQMGQLHRKEIAHAEVVLITHLLGLLVTFIGEGLTFRLLEDLWPRAPITDLGSSGKDSKREET